MDVNLPVQVILTELNRMNDPGMAFHKMLKVAEEVMPSKIWGRLGYNTDADLKACRTWLSTEIKKAGSFNGIYLGLDTLNMADGAGTNLEIGFSSSCLVENIKNENWLSDLDRRGSRHLIRGLFEMQKAYSKRKYEYEVRSFVEYVVFLAYSGVVLAAALRDISYEGSFIAMWGFHDGDLFCLAQRVNSTLTLAPRDAH